MSDGYTILTLADVDTAPHRENTTLIPIRHHLGFRAAGVNAWKADTGGRLIPPHEEDSGNEELYVVVSGRATFTVGDEEADATAGSLVFVPAEVFRTAIAAEDGTIVLVVGATVGEAFYGGGWDSFALADAYRQAGRLDESRAIMEEQIAHRPDHWGPRYNAACLEALGGHADAALEHLRRAKELDTEGQVRAVLPRGQRSRLASRRPTLSGAARMNLVHIDELDAIEMPEGFVWRPVRRHFGIRAFGTNVYTPGASGQVVEEHTEGQLEHEEIYLVLRGRVRFTIDGNDHELGPGQLVFVRDPSLKRGGVALTDDAAVLAIGGKPGQAHGISAWEYVFAAVPHIEAGRWEEAEQVMHEGLETSPGNPALLYNLACFEARSGKKDSALDHLLAATAANERFLEAAQTDDDLASIRDDPRFPR